MAVNIWKNENDFYQCCFNVSHLWCKKFMASYFLLVKYLNCFIKNEWKLRSKDNHVYLEWHQLYDATEADY